MKHRCLGIDFSPASIDYAQENNPDESRAEFVLKDVWDASFAGPHDLAMVLYGELNVFSPENAILILRKARESLSEQGTLIVEIQSMSSVESLGRSKTTQEAMRDGGLFSDKAHIFRTENKWLPENGISIQIFSIMETESGAEHMYRNTTKAWTDSDLADMLTEAGFSNAALATTWPTNSEALSLWTATTH